MESEVSPDSKSTPPKVYSAPRKFDLATILTVTFAYAMLFGALTLAAGGRRDAAFMMIAWNGGFITLVGLAQPILFGGKRPREASQITGGVAAIVIAFLLPDSTGFCALPFFLLFGVLLGYLAGALVGGVFLVADAVRGAITSMFPDEPELQDEAESSHPLD